MTIEGNFFSAAEVNLVRSENGFTLQFGEHTGFKKMKSITSETLGLSVISGLPFKAPAGSNFTIDQGYFRNVIHNSDSSSK